MVPSFKEMGWKFHGKLITLDFFPTGGVSCSHLPHRTPTQDAGLPSLSSVSMLSPPPSSCGAGAVELFLPLSLTLSWLWPPPSPATGWPRGLLSVLPTACPVPIRSLLSSRDEPKYRCAWRDLLTHVGSDYYSLGSVRCAELG